MPKGKGYMGSKPGKMGRPSKRGATHKMGKRIGY